MEYCRFDLGLVQPHSFLLAKDRWDYFNSNLDNLITLYCSGNTQDFPDYVPIRLVRIDDEKALSVDGDHRSAVLYATGETNPFVELYDARNENDVRLLAEDQCKRSKNLTLDSIENVSDEIRRFADEQFKPKLNLFEPDYLLSVFYFVREMGVSSFDDLVDRCNKGDFARDRQELNSLYTKAFKEYGLRLHIPSK